MKMFLGNAIEVFLRLYFYLMAQQLFKRCILADSWSAMLWALTKILITIAVLCLSHSLSRTQI
jgi:membrane protein insertase Oxa1/YidC/SpoIIIJ